MARHLPIHSFLGQLCDVSFAFSSRRVSFIPAHIFSRFAGSHSDERRTVLSLIDQTRGRPWLVYSRLRTRASQPCHIVSFGSGGGRTGTSETCPVAPVPERYQTLSRHVYLPEPPQSFLSLA